MFLNQLEQDNQKELFLSLATLVMMASGSSTENIEEDADDDSLKEFNRIKASLSSQDVLLKHLFGNIQAAEAQMVKEYMQELNYKYWVYNRCAIGCTAYDLDSILANSFDDDFDDDDQVDLVNLLKVYSTQVMTENVTFEEKESDKNLPYLLRSGMRLYVLKHAASAIIKGNTEDFSTKERKIILTELIGAGFSSGHFEEEEKELVQFIGTELDLDDEYFDEITEAMEKVFIANRELTELINE
ncbi:hypothetical protein [Pelistega europaea]|uniref:Uncharacterized protein n=1 Tax=Pelistega europaea TaxID=106147 RepID=A0A7Y4P5V6_9BURK|nr:hypothetical protein [Pelistega europaea]NOL49259.1 hypothetical protein [Pelistega europaea]